MPGGAASDRYSRSTTSIANCGLAIMSLPGNFLWGFATASYQIEGAPDEDGRGPSIWDTFCEIPGKIADGSSGAIACDSYRRWQDDVALLKSLGAQVYRFSISWSRVIPLGGRNDPVNHAGLDHYVRLVDALLEAGITPFITLFHWDLPDGLEKRYGGLLSHDEFPLDFEHYARTVFAAIPKCKHWITFNEPWCSSILGYSLGVFAPGRTSDRSRSAVGDSAHEPWLVGHNLLVAHGRAVRAYRDDFKTASPDGEIGITLNGDATYPWDPEDGEDVAAAQRKLEFSIAWFADPIYFGHYPESMRAQLGDRLPSFTEAERQLVQGSNDFYGMNHYTADYVRHRPGSPAVEDFVGHLETLPVSRAGEWIGPETQSTWLRPNPGGFRTLLGWISRRYGRPRVYVTENGTSIKGENSLPTAEVTDDVFRVRYFDEYVHAMAEAVRDDGVDVRGYMAWSLLDNFEWAEGYETRFGVTYVDYAGGQQRHPKKSALAMKALFASLVEHNQIPQTYSAPAVE
ncbi:beta-galactosidase [Grosmannia clavigera kw1407]|uniref:beta-glucosidase n=1 Tax=Grosmannia clavigera (strain kw1407 / UAMH 11150) TaxID=655863 RepID=F0XPY8_GROCL|nr:beta-galactosidase [Grosmannia clavigera kw1407]EFX00728.1 beta-galactosidase [Grosmannia clavigera kw1407]